MKLQALAPWTAVGGGVEGTDKRQSDSDFGWTRQLLKEIKCVG